MRRLLALADTRRRGQIPDKLVAIDQVLEVSARSVASEIERLLGTRGLVDVSRLDVSLMVNDGKRPPDRPMLRVVAAAGDLGEAYWNFALEEGDGNAGRAYKTNLFRAFDQEIPDYKRGSYVMIAGLEQHQFLYSMPLRHPADKGLIYGILNVGTFDKDQGALLRALNTDEGVLWLLEHGQKYVLQRVLDLI